MLYLLDANVLITAHNLYYPIDRVPEFWAWLVHKGSAGDLKIPVENYEEVKDGGTDEEKDLLFGWIKEAEVKTAILFEETVDADLVAKVIDEGYAPDLTDDEVVQIGRDPFLIAYALASPADRCVVTTEVSAPAKRRQNRRVPDVCTTMGGHLLRYLRHDEGTRVQNWLEAVSNKGEGRPSLPGRHESLGKSLRALASCLRKAGQQEFTGKCDERASMLEVREL
jgi:hypothetical protein